MPASRINFLGNLRGFVVLLVIVLHGSLTYMLNPPVWWYVVNPQNSLFFTALVLLIDVPIMQIMFFIAGYFAVPSLQKRGPSGFIREKILRIGIPWVLGVLLLAPPTTYLTYLSRNVPMSLWDFWRSDFWTKLYQQSVYWYLGVLFAMFLVLALVYSSSQRLRTVSGQVKKPSLWFFLGFGSVMSMCFFGLNQFFYMEDWKGFWYLFIFQPVRLPLYLGYFWLGLQARQNGWFELDGYKPQATGWVVAAGLSGLIYLGLRFSPAMATATPSVAAKLMAAILFNSFCLTALMAALAVFQIRVNGAGRLWSSLSDCSYGMYYFHPLILYPLSYVFLNIPMPVILKGFVVILLGFLLTWLLTSQVAKRLPLLRDVF